MTYRIWIWSLLRVAFFVLKRINNIPETDRPKISIYPEKYLTVDSHLGFSVKIRCICFNIRFFRLLSPTDTRKLSLKPMGKIFKYLILNC